MLTTLGMGMGEGVVRQCCTRARGMRSCGEGSQSEPTTMACVGEGERENVWERRDEEVVGFLVGIKPVGDSGGLVCGTSW